MTASLSAVSGEDILGAGHPQDIRASLALLDGRTLRLRLHEAERQLAALAQASGGDRSGADWIRPGLWNGNGRKPRIYRSDSWASQQDLRDADCRPRDFRSEAGRHYSVLSALVREEMHRRAMQPPSPSC